MLPPEATELPAEAPSLCEPEIENAKLGSGQCWKRGIRACTAPYEKRSNMFVNNKQFCDVSANTCKILSSLSNLKCLEI